MCRRSRASLLCARSSSRQAAADISAWRAGSTVAASISWSTPAPVELDTLEIEDLEVHNVAAVVLPPGVANENLLGLSFFGRLRRFEYADGKLVLEQ
ncbi:MAG: retroviral-like aspartic protease family protein [Xanthobacteraceae bacterium]